MTTIVSMISLPSFVQSLRDVVAVLPERGEALRSSLSRPAGSASDVPEGLARGEWARLVATFRFLYEVAAREGGPDVAEDLFKNADLASAFRQRDFGEQDLANLLAADPAVDERLRGERRRDGVLPVLADFRVTVDLRVLDLEPTDADPEVAPVVSMRLEFDEHVAGQDAVVFQVPILAVRDMIEDLNKAEALLRRVSKNPGAVSLPDWAAPE